MNKPLILSCGEVLWDLFPHGARFGGAPANFACHAAILGGEVSLLSAVGNDQPGQEAIAILQQYGVDTSLIQRIAAAPSGSVGVILDSSGKPSFEIHAGSAWDSIAWSTSLETHLAKIDVIYFGTLGQRGELSRSTIQRALKLAKDRNILRVLDVNLRQPFYNPALIRDSIVLASILKLSDEELPIVAAACDLTVAAIPGETLRQLLERFELDLVVLTCGAEGALLFSRSDAVFQPGIPTIVRDTVGAGDSFTAALVVSLLRGDSLPTIARTACEIAANICATDGAVPNVFQDKTLAPEPL